MDVVCQLMYTGFLDRSLTHLNNNYLALEEALGKEAFQSKIYKKFQARLFGDNWDNERSKFGYL
jgi:hypothetical protein